MLLVVPPRFGDHFLYMKSWLTFKDTGNAHFWKRILAIAWIGGGRGRARTESRARLELQRDDQQWVLEEIYGLLKSPISPFSKLALMNFQPILCIFLWGFLKLLVCLQCVKCCHPISLGTVSGSGIWVPLECPDLVDHVFQNSICKFRKLPHTVHHMVQPSLLRGLLYLKNQKHSLNSQTSLFSSTVMVSMATFHSSVLHLKCKWFLLKNTI